MGGISRLVKTHPKITGEAAVEYIYRSLLEQGKRPEKLEDCTIWFLHLPWTLGTRLDKLAAFKRFIEFWADKGAHGPYSSQMVQDWVMWECRFDTHKNQALKYEDVVNFYLNTHEHLFKRSECHADIRHYTKVLIKAATKFHEEQQAPVYFQEQILALPTEDMRFDGMVITAMGLRPGALLCISKSGAWFGMWRGKLALFWYCPISKTKAKFEGKDHMAMGILPCCCSDRFGDRFCHICNPLRGGEAFLKRFFPVDPKYFSKIIDLLGVQPYSPRVTCFTTLRVIFMRDYFAVERIFRKQLIRLCQMTGMDVRENPATFSHTLKLVFGLGKYFPDPELINQHGFWMPKSKMLYHYGMNAKYFVAADLPELQGVAMKMQRRPEEVQKMLKQISTDKLTKAREDFFPTVWESKDNRQKAYKSLTEEEYLHEKSMHLLRTAFLQPDNTIRKNPFMKELTDEQALDPLAHFDTLSPEQVAASEKVSKEDKAMFAAKQLSLHPKVINPKNARDLEHVEDTIRDLKRAQAAKIPFSLRGSKAGPVPLLAVKDCGERAATGKRKYSEHIKEERGGKSQKSIDWFYQKKYGMSEDEYLKK